MCVKARERPDKEKNWQVTLKNVPPRKYKLIDHGEHVLPLATFKIQGQNHASLLHLPITVLRQVSNT